MALLRTNYLDYSYIMMDRLQQLESQWRELLSRPRSKEEEEEMSVLAEQLTIETEKEIIGLINELKKAGIVITSIWDLVNTKKEYPEAIDILLKYLPLAKHEKNKEGIVRALTVKEAKGKASSLLIKEYENTPKKKDNLRWVIGNAIATVMTSQDIDWLISTVTDKTNGGSRRQLVKALRTVKSQQAIDVLNGLLDDQEMKSTALEVLKKIKYNSR